MDRSKLHPPASKRLRQRIEEHMDVVLVLIGVVLQVVGTAHDRTPHRERTAAAEGHARRQFAVWRLDDKAEFVLSPIPEVEFVAARISIGYVECEAYRRASDNSVSVRAGFEVIAATVCAEAFRARPYPGVQGALRERRPVVRTT